MQQLLEEDGKWHPIVFLSKSLSLVEQNYEVHNKELLAVMRSLEQWRHFLEGAKHLVEIWSNHKNLEYFQMAQNLNRRQAQCHFTSRVLTTHCITNPVPLWVNLMHFPDRADLRPSGKDNQGIVLLNPCSAS